MEMKANGQRQISPRETFRRAARRRPEEMTEPDEERVGVLLAEAVQKVARPVARELLPLPIPFRKRGGGKVSGCVVLVGP